MKISGYMLFGETKSRSQILFWIFPYFFHKLLLKLGKMGKNIIVSNSMQRPFSVKWTSFLSPMYRIEKLNQYLRIMLKNWNCQISRIFSDYIENCSKWCIFTKKTILQCLTAVNNLKLRPSRVLVSTELYRKNGVWYIFCFEINWSWKNGQACQMSTNQSSDMRVSDMYR